MSKHQDQRSKNESATSAHPPADEAGWSPLFRALRREFRDNLARIAAGNDPVTRLLGYRNLLRSRYGVDLPAPEDQPEGEPDGDNRRRVDRENGEGSDSGQ